MSPTDRTVPVEGGLLEARIVDGVLSCLGVPYAAAPFGPLRFRAPQPHPGWKTKRSAHAFASMAVQTPLGRMARAGEIAATAAFLASEDASFFVGATLTPSGGLVTV